MNTDFPAGKAPATLSVSQLNRQARTLLESHFDFVWVSGEISNFLAHGSGHWYFSLKDGDAQVRCAMFRNRNQRLRFRPGNGDAVRLRARVSIYQARGEFQLTVEFIEPAGEGALQLAFEALKTRLAAEGLFAKEHKQPLPALCQHLGIVTSQSGAALQDILTVLQRRWPAMQVTVFATPVQGEGAAEAIAVAIAKANHKANTGEIPLDALIVGRGGGSLEDLWAFNEEIVARAIASSTLPVVSAVGHETDFSIADLVADKRAATPSAAAELLSPDQGHWLEQLQSKALQLNALMQRRLSAAAAVLHHLRRRLRHPSHHLREHSQRLDDLQQRLVLAQRHQLRSERGRLALLANRLHSHSPAQAINARRDRFEVVQERLQAAMWQQLKLIQQRVHHLTELLDSLSPLRTLDRGFAVISKNHEVVRQTKQLTVGDVVEARLSDGYVALNVADIRPDEASS